MAVHSMTGFARTQGASEAAAWYWELRSVNGKGFELRVRLPTGFEALEPRMRKIASAKLVRGTLHASLTMTRHQGVVEVRLNEGVLEQIVSAARRASEITGGGMPDTAALIGLHGVLEFVDQEARGELAEQAGDAILLDFERTLDELLTARAGEGQRLQSLVSEQVAEIERLTRVVENSPARSQEAIRARLAQQIARLVGTDQSLDPDRLHQEAVLIATRADVEEELKRLAAHVAAARDLLANGGSIGRKLDFLAQEFQREANTLCSKSIDTTMTEAGLALKVKIDQMREQVQNLE
jgi:uncharacterized protein (TIGR00255 family)